MRMMDLEQVVSAGEGRLAGRLRELVEVESPSEDKAAVDRAGELVAGWAEALGGKVRRHRQKAFGDVLELRFGPARSKRGRVLMLGHLDTVWPMGTLARMPWREAEGKFWGPGVLDMKAGVAMAFEAVAALRELEAERPVTLLLVSEEEVGSPVSRGITERLAAECAAVLVLEPAQGLAYKTARKGVGNYELRVEGVGSHAGVDFESGHSAVREMARLVETVSAIYRPGKRIDGERGGDRGRDAIECGGGGVCGGGGCPDCEGEGCGAGGEAVSGAEGDRHGLPADGDGRDQSATDGEEGGDGGAVSAGEEAGGGDGGEAGGGGDRGWVGREFYGGDGGADAGWDGGGRSWERMRRMSMWW